MIMLLFKVLLNMEKAFNKMKSEYDSPLIAAAYKEVDLHQLKLKYLLGALDSLFPFFFYSQPLFTVESILPTIDSPSQG
jgi:hypothetical protein